MIGPGVGTAVLVWLAVIACEPFGPPVPAALIPFDPATNPLGYPTRDAYHIWWAEMEACTGRRGHYRDVDWLYLPDANGRTLPGWGGAVGRYDRARRSIWLVERWLTERAVVAHEMVHALLPEAGHPAEFDRCGMRLGSVHAEGAVGRARP